MSPHVTQEGEGSRTRDEDNVATWSAADKDEAVSKRLLELMADGGGGSIWDIAFFGAMVYSPFVILSLRFATYSPDGE